MTVINRKSPKQQRKRRKKNRVEPAGPQERYRQQFTDRQTD